MIKVILDNNNEYIINLIDSPLKNKIVNALKHLQNVKLPYTQFDNRALYNYDNAAKQLVDYSHILGIDIEIGKIKQQSYLNHLHKIYEEKYYNDCVNESNWLSYHEAIHMIEETSADYKIKKSLTFDYRNFAGFLNTNYSFNELKNFTLIDKPGDVMVVFNELGKTPFLYWRDQEPDDLTRFCQLAKPLIRFNFAIKLCLEEQDKSQTKGLDDFKIWYSKYKKDWCNYWNIPDWSIEQILGSIKVGYCKDWEKILDEISNGSEPVYLKLL